LTKTVEEKSMRRLAPITLMIVVWMGAALPALAGGAVWEFEQYQRPGEEVLASTAVSWDHTSLGTPEQGPYFVYLAPMDVEFTWPGLPEEAVLVGLVEVYEGPYQDRAGYLMGPNHAVARFEIPDIEPGSYQILQCNDPCTSTLGDIVGGWDLRILSGPDGRPEDEIAAEVREAAKELPLLYREDPATRVAKKQPVVEPVTPVYVTSGTNPIPIEAIDTARESPFGEGATTAVEGGESESLADVLTVALAVSVVAMVWVGWNRGPEKKKKEVVG
jgi:hypothetical protein